MLLNVSVSQMLNPSAVQSTVKGAPPMHVWRLAPLHVSTQPEHPGATHAAGVPLHSRPAAAQVVVYC